MTAPHTPSTSPWRGEVGSRSEPGGGESFCALHPTPIGLRPIDPPPPGEGGNRARGAAIP
jgi:hypothetical protein